MRRFFLIALASAVACSGEVDELDAGLEPDAGTTVDAGRRVDAGPPRDAGEERDAGFQRDAGEEERDAGPPRDGGSTPRLCELSLAPIFQGGTSTTALDGRLVVFAVDALDGAPVVNATVVVETADDVWQEATDGAGCVDIVDSDLRGAVTIGVYAHGRVYRTVYGVDRDRATFVIHTPSFNVLPDRPARVIGIVDGWSVLTASTATRPRIGTVEPIHTDIFRPTVTQRMRGVGGLFANVALVGGPQMANLVDYDMLVDGRFTSGLVVRGGTVEVDGINETHIGISTGLVIRPDEIQMGRRLIIDTPMDVNVTIFRGTPTGLIQNVFTPAVFLPNAGGMFALESFVDTGDTAFRVAAPRVDGALAGATYGAVAMEWQQSMDTGAFSVGVVPGTSSTTIQLPTLPQPPALAIGIRTIDVELADEVTDFVRVEVPDGWTIGVIDPERTFTIRIPRPPIGYDDPLLVRADAHVTALGLDGVRLHDVAVADPYSVDRPTKPDFARGIRRWVQRTTAVIP